MHLLMARSTAAFSDYIYKITMQGLSRLNTHVRSQARPITPDLLSLMYDHLDTTKPEDAVFWTICVFAFFLLFRKSNLVPDTLTGFRADRHLTRDDVIITRDNVIVGIRWAKNHQFGRELLTFPMPILHGSKMCPLAALQNMFAVIQGTEHEFLFKLGNNKCFTYRQFQNKLRVVLAAAGVENPEKYSSHSFRRGGATFAFLCGVPPEIIKVLGGWKSDAYLDYIYLPIEARLAAGQLIKIRLMHKNFKYM